jgi:hypothetical protein
VKCQEVAEPLPKKRTRPVVPYGKDAVRSDGEESQASRSSAEPERSRPIVLLLAFVVLAGMGWFLIQNLTRSSKEQDCMMAGRKNCAPIDTSSLPK